MLSSYKQTGNKEDTEKERGDTMAENNTKELDFDRKHEEDLQRLRGLRLLDDDFMQKVFEDKACTEFFVYSGDIEPSARRFRATITDE